MHHLCSKFHGKIDEQGVRYQDETLKQGNILDNRMCGFKVKMVIFLSISNQLIGVLSKKNIVESYSHSFS